MPSVRCNGHGARSNWINSDAKASNPTTESKLIMRFLSFDFVEATIKPYQLKRVHGCTLFGVDGLALDLMRLFAEAHEGVPQLLSVSTNGAELFAHLRVELVVAVLEDGHERAVHGEIDFGNFADQDVFVGRVVGEQGLRLLGLWLGLGGWGGWGRISFSHDSASALDWLAGV